MKRVKSACIFQTLIFQQKEDFGYSRERAAALNHEELERYKASLEKTHTRYQITEETNQPDDSVIIVSESNIMNGRMSVNILKNSNKLRKSNSGSVEFQTEFCALFFCV